MAAHPADRGIADDAPPLGEAVREIGEADEGDAVVQGPPGPSGVACRPRIGVEQQPVLTGEDGEPPAARPPHEGEIGPARGRARRHRRWSPADGRRGGASRPATMASGRASAMPKGRAVAAWTPWQRA